MVDDAIIDLQSVYIVMISGDITSSLYKVCGRFETVKNSGEIQEFAVAADCGFPEVISLTLIITFLLNMELVILE